MGVTLQKVLEEVFRGVEIAQVVLCGGRLDHNPVAERKLVLQRLRDSDLSVLFPGAAPPASIAGHGSSTFVTLSALFQNGPLSS